MVIITDIEKKFKIVKIHQFSFLKKNYKTNIKRDSP